MKEKETVNEVCEKYVAAYKNGDESAAEQLYNLTIKKSTLIAAAVADISQDIEDIVQESYMYAFKNILQLKDDKKFQSWLNVIVANKSKDYLYKNKWHPLFLMDNTDAELWVEEKLQKKDLSSADFENDEKSQIVWDMVKTLPKDMCLCVTMYYYEEMSVSEIAQVLGIAEGTVKSRLYHARKRIKEQVEETEKKGIKLYGTNLSVAALIISAFLNEEKKIKGFEFSKIAGGSGIKKPAGKSMSSGAKIGIGVSVVAAAALSVTVAVTALTGSKKHDTPENKTENTHIVDDDDSLNDENISDEKISVPVMAREQPKGLKLEVVCDDIISRAGAVTDENTNIAFISKNIFEIKNYKYQGVLCTTEGKKIEAGEYTSVKAVESTYESQCSENYFAISYDNSGEEGNTYGLMNIDGQMIIPEEYSGFKMISPVFIVAYRSSGEDNIVEYDVYNLETHEKVDNLTGLHTDTPEWDAFYAGYEVIFRKYYIDDKEEQMIVNKEGEVLFCSEGKSEEGYFPVYGDDYGKSHKLYFFSHNPNNGGQMEIRNDNFEIILSEDDEICPDNIEDEEAGNFVVVGILSDDIFIIKEAYEDNCYLYDNKKKKVISAKYGRLSGLGNGYVLAVDAETEKMGLISKDGKKIIDCVYEIIPVRFDSVLDDYVGQYKNDEGIRKQLELGVFEAIYDDKLVYVNLKGEIVKKDFGELASWTNISSMLEGREKQQLIKDIRHTDGERDIYHGKQLTMFAPGGTMEIDGNLSFMSGGAYIFAESKEKEHYRYEYTVYDYMLEPLLKYEMGKGGSISTNEELSYAAVKTDEEITLYKISQK